MVGGPSCFDGIQQVEVLVLNSAEIKETSNIEGFSCKSGGLNILQALIVKRPAG